jgi:hypothetical protein
MASLLRWGHQKPDTLSNPLMNQKLVGMHIDITTFLGTNTQ